MISILDGASKYCFYWRGGDPPPAEPPGDGKPRNFLMQFSTESQARFLLQGFQQSWEFRRLSASDPLADPIRWNSDQILSHLARQLATGRLLVERRWREMRGEPAAQISGRQVVPRKMDPVETAEPIVEPPTFPAEHEPDSQADTLIEAADSGAPFCEECERARQQMAAAQQQPASQPAAQAPPPVPPENSFPENHDAIAQARTLGEAAEKGSPFCEECEKARQLEAA